VQTAEQEILNRLGKKMLDVLEKYAKDNGYAVVMDVSNPQTPVLYAHPGTNITKNLVDAYNAESPAAAVAHPKPAGSNAARPAGAAASRPPASGAGNTEEAVSFRRLQSNRTPPTEPKEHATHEHHNNSKIWHGASV